MEIEKRQCDVLCVGGGIAGLMAGVVEFRTDNTEMNATLHKVVRTLTFL